MEATIKKNAVRKLDKGKLANRKRTTMSTESAIKDISVIEWAEEILNGSKKVVINKSIN